MKETTLRKWMGGWELFIGLGAIAGAAMMFADTTGRMFGMEPMLPAFRILPLHEVLFHNLLFPGIALLLCNGLTNIVAFISAEAPQPIRRTGRNGLRNHSHALDRTPVLHLPPQLHLHRLFPFRLRRGTHGFLSRPQGDRTNRMSASTIRHPLCPKNQPPADLGPSLPNTTQKHRTTIPRILPFAAALFILTACTPRNLPDGWYTTSGEGPDAPIGTPIVTCSDFAALRLDSLSSGEDRFVYQITGSVKPEKRKRWRAATRKAVGHHIVFLYEGEVLAAPCINMPIDGGTFAISAPEISGNADRMREIFQRLEAQMR